MTATTWALQKLYSLSLKSHWKKFLDCTKHPQTKQEQLLKSFLKRNANSAYGKAYGYENITSISEFQNKLPIVSYDELEPWIKRAAQGEPSVLTTEKILMFERTGGSTSTNKLIPYTQTLRLEFDAMSKPWMANALNNLSGLYGTKTYLSISPATRGQELTAGGIPIGFENETEYLNPLNRWLWKQVLAVPSEIARQTDMHAWKFETSKYLLNCEDLGLLSVWSPTFLIQLCQFMEANLDSLLPKLNPKRAQFITAQMNKHGKFVGESIWPHLALLSCWTDGISALFIPELKSYFPKVFIQPKGLLATEGVVSFPLLAPAEEGNASPALNLGSVLGIQSHFLEFLDADNLKNPAVLAHELQIGKFYSPVLTTGGGLCRYHLRDVVKCNGYFQHTPLITFEGKLDRTSDLCGEKINARQVEYGLELARTELGIKWFFAMLVPVQATPSHYRLYIETDSSEEVVRRAIQILEGHLKSGHHYNYCLSLGQLKPMTFQKVTNGHELYTKALLEKGQRQGDIKPTSLDSRLFWPDVFGAQTEIP